MKKAPVLNEKQYKSLLNATKMTRYADRNRMMVVLSYGVGLRACEIAAITVGDVLDSENNVRETVFLGAHQTKRDRNRILSILATLYEKKSLNTSNYTRNS